jgi:hypothetical protein
MTPPTWLDAAGRRRPTLASTWLVALLFLMACVAPLSPDLRASIKSVSIAQHVIMPDEALGIFARGNWGCQCKSNANDAMRAGTQRLGPVARVAFVEELERAGIFRSIISGTADAEIQLTLEQIKAFRLVSGDYRPNVLVRAILRRSDGTVAWQGWADYGRDERVPTGPLHVVDFDLATRAAIETLVRRLGGPP